ncbi:PQQ-dependent sugar dehydrogenase [Altererythrobacter sp. C41]|uniref:PQQ-dependent sugar dehydrogenase n=1 Tax=Altererythrobacter sp. C41 TaxID=2806021 RepID=UPI00193383F9|nr:sorbosone dehydrogenase family protein [Altererythrobacter sp. C41]MBM0171120.1 sorbosone dehydrogenase family protein [Altererythrobacter sp. C41]
MRTLPISAALAAALLLSACGGGETDPVEYGAAPQLPEPHRGLLPAMNIADPVNWGEERPVVPEGYSVTAIASDLKIPRQTLVLPNGDILIAEGKGGGAPILTPKDLIAGYIKKQGTSAVKGGDRLTLLRDADGDGVYEGRAIFAENLNAPYGLALIGNRLFVANQDALVRFDYTPGQVRASGPPVEVTKLPSEINHHWTKALTAGPEGRYLYVGIGSNSNVGERGMSVEEDRAVIWQVDAETGLHRVFASGLRNPTALAIGPSLGQLWAVVNERDELGPDLVPDYLTSVRQGAFYGWPYSYWGENVDPRVRPEKPEKVASAVRPDYSLGSHTAPLGLAFSSPAMGPRFADGVFVGMHGSWNRANPSGYKVVFIPFRGGRPAGQPVDFVTNFMGEDGKTRGRPVGVSVDPRGALIVADDLSNTIWRIAPLVQQGSNQAPPGNGDGARSQSS